MSLKKLPQINAAEFPRGEKYRIDEKIYSRWNVNVKASEDDKNTITIYESIGEDFWGDGFTAKRMSAALRSIGKENDVIVSINSPGGDFFEGATIYNLLSQHEGKVTVKIPGLAASAASIIAMAGDNIQISEIGFYMIHNAWGMVIGNRNDMRQSADTFEKFDSAMADVYAARTGIPKDEIMQMMDSDTWINGTEAVDKGFANEFLPKKAVSDDANDDKKSKSLARRSIEASLARQGYSRKEREELLQKAFGERDAAGSAARDAGLGVENEAQLKELLNTIKGG